MFKISAGANFTIFLLFFGVAVLEAFQTRNWLKCLFWLMIAVVFLMSDQSGKENRQDK